MQKYFLQDGKMQLGANPETEKRGWISFVLALDAETAVEQARREGYAQGLANASVIVTNTKEVNDAVRADERERIVRELEDQRIRNAGIGIWNGLTLALDVIKQSRPKSLEYPGVSRDSSDWIAWGKSIVDAINEIRSKLWTK